MFYYSLLVLFLGRKDIGNVLISQYENVLISQIAIVPMLYNYLYFLLATHNTSTLVNLPVCILAHHLTSAH